jgi:hypothetical protein
MKKLIIALLSVYGVLCFFSDPQVVNPDDWFRDYYTGLIVGCACLWLARLLWKTTQKE